jgi:hypothetical protein
MFAEKRKAVTVVTGAEDTLVCTVTCKMINSSFYLSFCQASKRHLNPLKYILIHLMKVLMVRTK